MKARVKATGEIVDVEKQYGDYLLEDGTSVNIYKSSKKFYLEDRLDFENIPDVKDEPDYWEKLKHQYAGMMMAGMLANSEWEAIYERLSECAIEAATILVEKLKNEK